MLKIELNIQIPVTGLVVLISHSIAEATASWSTIEDILRVRCSYCDRHTVHAVAAAYPQSTVSHTLTCSNLSGTASYETHIADLEKSGCERDYIASGTTCLKGFWSIIW